MCSPTLRAKETALSRRSRGGCIRQMERRASGMGDRKTLALCMRQKPDDRDHGYAEEFFRRRL